ncbi:MAG TPA: asparaginase [Candidatus Dormibacteraeota bacterium]|nr:asparaginase [Candidatus Dormibacteraeota bacterium]
MSSEVSTAPALLAESRRGGIVEGLIRGHLVLVDGAGQLVRGVGDPQTMTTLRSAAKPFQAASFVESGAAAALGLGQESIAIACSSHHGEPGHLQAARRILAAAGLKENALRCGAHLPVDPQAAAELLRSGASPTAIHNNCSGKHAAMLATCVHRGWPTESYLERGHPLQLEIASRLARHAGLEVDRMPWGIDGCGLPTFGVSLQDFAAALARAASSDLAFQTCQAAMAQHPWLIGGTTSFDTALVRAAGDTLTAKGGAAAIFGAVARDGSWALVVKLEAGAPAGLPQIAVHSLQQLGHLGTLPSALAPTEVTNWAGTVVGEIRVLVQL